MCDDLGFIFPEDDSWIDALILAFAISAVLIPVGVITIFVLNIKKQRTKAMFAGFGTAVVCFIIALIFKLFFVGMSGVGFLIYAATVNSHGCAKDDNSDKVQETSESVVKENNNSYKLEDKNDDWDFL